jgi:hypothetical protein
MTVTRYRSRGSHKTMWVEPSSASCSSLTRRQRTQFGPNSGLCGAPHNPDYAKRSVMRSDEAWTEGLRGLRAVRAPHNPRPWSRGAAPGATPQRPVQRDQTSA